MAQQQWQVDGPRIIEVGDPQERVAALQVAIVGGHVGVVTHDDSPVARLEVAEVEGPPLTVSWDGRTLRVLHGKDATDSVIAALRRLIEEPGRHRAEVSLSMPAHARTTISTVSASVVAGGLRAGLTVNTVSGEVALHDVSGRTKLNTVSGAAECVGLDGDVKLNTVSGAITVQDSRIGAAKLNTVSGEITLDLRNGRATLASNSVSGDVTVRAPYTGYAVTATSATGQVVVDGRLLAKGRSPGTLTDGDGSLQISANSVSGSVVVLRAAASGPPTPQDAPPNGDRAGRPDHGDQGEHTAYPQDRPAGTHPHDGLSTGDAGDHTAYPQEPSA
jgi:hypothetical protein